MENGPVRVVYTDPGGEGYHCVFHMARLAADLLGAELASIRPGSPGMGDKLAAILLPRRRSGSSCLLICPSPADLSSILLLGGWRERFNRVVAWVFDSFWTNWIPPWVHASRLLDHVYVTEQEDIEVWRRKVHAPVDWLPWGSDVLNLGSPNPERTFDLLRFGRQPPEWDDDLANRRACEDLGLRFQGRPRSLSDASENEAGLMGMLSKAKFTLAFTNRVSPGRQTHPEREYITGRWTDSVAAGATVAGIPPSSDSVKALLWPEAMVHIGTVNRAEGLQEICSLVRQWTPNRARSNYLKALGILDWRWRFKTLAEALGVDSPRLDEDLLRISRVIGTARQGSEGIY